MAGKRIYTIEEAAERRREQNLASYHRNREKALLYMRAYSKDPAKQELRLARSRRCRAKNRDKIVQGQREHYYRNREKILAAQKIYWEKRREVLGIKKAYRVSPEEAKKKFRIRAKKYKAMRRGVNYVPQARRLALLERQQGKCAACFCDCRNKFHIDHILPARFGGKNTDENLQVLCSRCNISKCAKPWETWLLDRHIKQGYQLNRGVI